MFPRLLTKVMTMLSLQYFVYLLSMSFFITLLTDIITDNYIMLIYVRVSLLTAYVIRENRRLTVYQSVTRENI